jgi:hypothetical protein
MQLQALITIEITVTVLDCTPEVRHDNFGDNAVAAPCPDPVLP